MSDLKSLLELLLGLITSPAYYTSSERNISDAAVALAALGALIAGFAFRRKTSFRLILALLAIAGAAFIVYANIVDVALMHWPQTACRAIIIAALGYSLGFLAPGGSDDDKAKDDKSDRARLDEPSSSPTRTTDE
jgi:peptidoglycan/LPS O-acetylase OafA/YrhL